MNAKTRESADSQEMNLFVLSLYLLLLLRFRGSFTNLLLGQSQGIGTLVVLDVDILLQINHPDMARKSVSQDDYSFTLSEVIIPFLDRILQ